MTLKSTTNEQLKKAYNKILQYQNDIKTKFQCVPLIGAIGGSISLNLANEASDIDFYLITKNQSYRDILNTMYCESGKIDFMCVELQTLIEECEMHSIQAHKYPTRFYRNQAITNSIMQKRDTDRPGFKREMIMRIFLADEIFEFEPRAAKKVYQHLQQGLTLIDAWDYHYNRAYGNYYEYIHGKKQVLLRKYLYTISQITIGYMLLHNETVVMNYCEMLENFPALYEDTNIIEICNQLWYLNKSADLGRHRKNLCVKIISNTISIK